MRFHGDGFPYVDHPLTQAFGGRTEWPIHCPVCKHETVHAYLHRFRADRDRGGSWVWCSACGSYEHGSVRVPSWWTNHPEVEFSKLTHAPDYLDGMAPQVDAHWLTLQPPPP